MSVELVLVVSGIVISTLVAYHIAAKQGLFDRTSLLDTHGPPDVDEIPQKPVRLLIMGIPSSARRNTILILPYLVINRGLPVIRNLWLEFLYPKDISPARLTSVAPKLSRNLKLSTTRQVTSLGETTQVTYDISLLRRDDRQIIGEYVVFDKSTLETLEEGLRLRSHDVSCFSNAENTRFHKHKVRIVFVESDSLEFLMETFPEITKWAITKDSVPMIRFAKAIWSRMSRGLFLSEECLLIQPVLSTISDDVSCESSILGEWNSQYISAHFGMFITKIPWKNRVPRPLLQKPPDWFDKPRPDVKN